MSDPVAPNSQWYKDAIIYALNIRSFYDQSGNGIGDINGLIEKLDYLEDLGITCISLLPFFDSPLKDGGYDVRDFTKVHPDYGTIDHFQQLLAATQQRDIKVMIDLAINHTSTEHAWFQQSRQAPPFTPERDYYIWSDKPDKFGEARLLFPDFETSNWEWDNVAGAYYWHRFFSHEADLNFHSEAVREEIRKIIDFWYELGVDAIRLTSVAYLYEREGTDCENLPEVHQYLRELRDYVDRRHPGKVLAADTNLWPEEAAQYFGDNDECHINYHFPLMPRLYMALQTEDRYPVIDILEQTPKIPENCQWALFLRNHDDLMLSMVTEEEQDFLLRVYAQEQGAQVNRGIRRRLAPLLNNDRRKIELLNSLLFSLPGTPVIYYGDEIGMGDNIYLSDRKGVRTPMQWSADRNAGFSNANPQRLFLPVIHDPLYRYEAVNVEVQNRNSSSLLWWMKNIVAIRKRLKAFSHGSIQFLPSVNSKVLAFIRSHEGESILVLCNLSKHSQAIEIDLAEYQGVEPVEILSQNKFFTVGSDAYQFTLGPYGYYWFLLDQQETVLEETPQERVIPEIEVEVPWNNLFAAYTTRRIFEKRVLANYLQTCRWFGGKSRKIVALSIQQYPAMAVADDVTYFLNIQVRYTDGLPETYCLPVSFITAAERIVGFLKRENASVICYLKTADVEGILVDALYEENFRTELFWQIKTNGQINLPEGILRFESGKILDELKLEKPEIRSEVLRAEQSNTSIIYNKQFFFKIYRKLDTDVNPDLELVRFLSDRTDYAHCPRYGGGIQYENLSEKSFTILGLLQNRIPNEGEAWTMMLKELGQYYERVMADPAWKTTPPTLVRKPRFYYEDIPDTLSNLIGKTTYDRVVLLAQRTAEMHIALASDPHDPDFKPEPFTQNYQRSIYSGHRKLVSERFNALSHRLAVLPSNAQDLAKRVLDLQADILDCFREIYSRKIAAEKIRIHGDYHLGQVLFNGRDFFIIDFEGEPMLSISERRLKKTPFKDVAGMIRSLHYAAYGQLYLSTNYRQADMPALEKWAAQWFHYIGQAFLTAYLDRIKGQQFVPEDEESIQLLLRSYMLEKAIYEVGYEMNSRPDWVRIPLRGVLYVMENYK